jgi:protein-S-isoprenylcysteine O-methyltransferase Ste14
MNTIKTILYMGSMHGFFTFYFPYLLASQSQQIFEPGIIRLLAFPLWLTGTSILIRCSIDIVSRGRGTPAHLDPPRRLIVNGFYRLVRNPIYLGALLVQLGFIAWFGSGLLIAYFIFFMIAFHLMILLIEEPILKNTFGREYEDYMNRVPRWIPHFRTCSSGLSFH